MIDAKAFGAELADIVKTATAPLLRRIGQLEKQLADMPAVRDGKDGADGRDGSDGKDGASVTLADVLPALKEQVAEYLSGIPAPQDGKDGANGKDGADGRDGENGDPGRDGLDVKDLFRADGGRLVAVMSDGTTKDLGEYVGKDGAAGANGKDGADGRDGFGFDDLTFEQAGERSAVLRFAKGERVKEFAITLPGFVDRGVWKDAEAYQPGDGVTYGGSFWIAQAGADGRPDTGKGWRLAVKKGRDGKDGRDGEKGLQGAEGRPGRDLTQLGGDGSKW